MNRTSIRILLAALSLAAVAPAFAAGETTDLDTRFRAKLMKEKLKIGAEERKNSSSDQNGGLDSAQCGSQNIGNVNTNGRIGTAPREVFVFAPNAINLVSGNGCR